MSDAVRRMLIMGLVAVMVPTYSACTQSTNMTDLKNLAIPGVEPFFFQDESTIPLDLTVTRLADDFKAKGAARGPDGDRLAADERTTNDAIAQAVSERLGKAWKRSAEFSAPNPAVAIMVWETTNDPKRFYAIAAWNKVHTSTEGRKYRPLLSVFTRAN